MAGFCLPHGKIGGSGRAASAILTFIYYCKTVDKGRVPAQFWRTMKSLQLIDCRIIVFAATVLAGFACFGEKMAKGNVGLQLYSLRAQLDKDVPGTLAEVKSWGVKYVELAGTYKMSPQEFKGQLDSHGLVPISGHFSYDRWRDNPEGVLAEAEIFGLKYVGCAWIPHNGAFDEATCREAIKVFNHAAALADQHHMKFFYHTHGYEFQPFENGTLFDLMMKELQPDVKLEMDIFWIVHAGQDPVELLKKFKKRYVSLALEGHEKRHRNGAAHRPYRCQQ